MTEAHRPRNDTLPLDAMQCSILDIVLDLIVPPGPDGLLPGASQVGVPAHLRAWAPQLSPALTAELDRLAAESRSRHGCDFPALQAAQRGGVGRLRGGLHELVEQQQRVVQADARHVMHRIHAQMINGAWAGP